MNPSFHARGREEFRRHWRPDGARFDRLVRRLCRKRGLIGWFRVARVKCRWLARTDKSRALWLRGQGALFFAQGRRI